MPVSLKWPGVYIEEIKSPVRTIVGVSTSVTAFVGRARKGPLNDPFMIHSFADYVRTFGGLWRDSTMSYAVDQYFRNGGSDALIVRIINGGNPASRNITGAFTLQAKNPGTWANDLKIGADYKTKAPADTTLFNLFVLDKDGAPLESFRNVSTQAGTPRYVADVLKAESKYVEVNGNVAGRPAETTPATLLDFASGTAGTDGNALVSGDYVRNALPKTDLYALDNADIFNLLCVPPPTFATDFTKNERDTFAKYCADNRAMYIVDPPSTWVDERKPLDNAVGLDTVIAATPNAAVYFPHLLMTDPEQDGRLEKFVPCGVIAGIMARTDATRGVWKAPAGIETQLFGVIDLAIPLSNPDSGTLNPAGINCLRSFTGIGNVVWGARTREGADALASEWKYVPVRRLALYLEESLYRGTQWVVFEPNDEPLWSQIRLNVGAFMHSLFRQGAFQGMTPKDAYRVECSADTTTEDDRNRGVVNIIVSFAPLKPAEFVVIKIQQLAGQIQT